MTKIKVAASQMPCSWDIDANIALAETLVRDAAAQGAQIILLQELFETPYFCQDVDEKYKELAKPLKNNALIQVFQKLAAELEVVLPVSYYEKGDNGLYNSIVIIDADGTIKNHYRKTHIPEFPGYHENEYFDEGDSGFKVTQTRYAKIGVGICWDQWFPEAARAMTLMGAELLFYPTAIGSEPSQKNHDSRDHWQRVMQGHSGANLIPVIASNRVGTEAGKNTSMQFYGSSFITNCLGAKIEEAHRESTGVIVAEVDLAESALHRQDWGVFQTRQPKAYGILCEDLPKPAYSDTI